MSEHTKGPWKAYPAEHLAKGSEDPNLFFTIGPRQFHTVAEIRPGNPDDGLPDQTPANARLIAAAPDLLEALEGLLPLAIAIREVELGPLCGDDPEWPAIAAAKSAITKAKGEPQ